MIKDAFIYFLSKLFPALISFGILFLYLNHLDPKEYGLYSLILVSIGLTNILVNQWIRSSYLRFKNRFSDSDNIFFSQQVIMLILSNLFILCIMYYLELSLNILLLVLVIFNLLVINEFYSNFFRIYLRPLIILNANLIKNSIFFITLIISIYVIQLLNIYIALGAYGLGLLISSLYYVFKSKFLVKVTFNYEYLKTSLKYGLPITLSFALGVLLQNIDKYMISYLLGVEATGNYSMGFDFIHNFFYMTMASLASASLPRLLNQSQSFDIVIDQYREYTQLFIYITMPIFFTLINLREEISSLFYKFNYQIDPSLIFFIIIATFAHGLKSYVYDQAIQLYEKTTLIFVPTTIAVIINVIVNFLFLEKYGLIIASISSLIAFTASALLTYALIRKEIKIKYDFIYISVTLITSLILLYFLNAFEIDNVFMSVIIKALINIVILTLVTLLFIYYKRREKNESRCQ